MDCCLGSCNGSSGQISEKEDCWPCKATCESLDLSIGYTTQQMQVNESQALWAEDAILGTNIPADMAEDIGWIIVSGGGTISPAGLYTAPAANPDCLNNAIIGLTCLDAVVATLQIAINAIAGNVGAYSNRDWIHEFNAGCFCSEEGGYCFCTDRIRTCTGELYLVNGVQQWRSCEGESGCTTEPSSQPCSTNSCPVIQDLRSSAFKAAGCCPEELL